MKRKIKSVVEILLQDPTNLDELSFPRLVKKVYLYLNRDLNQIINDPSKPESELINEAIIAIGFDLNAYGRGVLIMYFCSHCGGGLGLRVCYGCGSEFKDDGWRSGCNTSLPQKVVAFLQENGHQFGIDPEVARGKEHAIWRKLK